MRNSNHFLGNLTHPWRVRGAGMGGRWKYGIDNSFLIGQSCMYTQTPGFGIQGLLFFSSPLPRHFVAFAASTGGMCSPINVSRKKREIFFSCQRENFWQDFLYRNQSVQSRSPHTKNALLTLRISYSYVV